MKAVVTTSELTLYIDMLDGPWVPASPSELAASLQISDMTIHIRSCARGIRPSGTVVQCYIDDEVTS